MIRLWLTLLSIGVALVWAPQSAVAQEGRAAAALLTLADLPAGWTASDQFTGPSTGRGGFCGEENSPTSSARGNAVESAESRL